MKKICFGKNITTVNSRMSNLTDNIKSSLREVYRFPQNLVDVSNCFNGCVNLTKFEAELPNTIKNMSSSFEGCGNFYKNVAIPSDCIDMSRSFKGSGIKGSINIPDKVVDMRESFKDSKLEAVSFNENISHFNNFQESFVNCKTLAYVYGNLPQNIKNANSAFKNTSVTEVNFFKENSFIDDATSMFESCSNLKSASVDFNTHYINAAFNNCRNLVTVGNIKSNGFSSTWNGCSNLKSIGVINGILNFNNTFNGCNNYSNVVYLHPYFDGTDNSYLSINDTDRNFLNNQALKIYGVGHGLENELNFQNAHLEKGDYISGYCDPDDFEINKVNKTITKNGQSVVCTTTYFSNHNVNINALVIPKFFRTNLLNPSTKYNVVFNNAFKNKTFKDVIVYGMNIQTFAFNGSAMNNLKIYPDTVIGRYSFNNISANNLVILNNANSINIGFSAFGSSNIKTGYIYPDINKIENQAFARVNGNLFIGNINNASFYGVFENFGGNIKSYDKTQNHIINVVGINAFANIKGIMDIPVKNIGNNAFYNATNQDFIDLSSTTYVGTNAFYNTKITSLYVPDNITLLSNSFRGMNALTSLNTNLFATSYFYTCPPSLKDVELRGSSYSSSYTRFLTSAENITMRYVGSLVENQFYNMTNLKYVKFGGVMNLPNNAFYNCTNLISAGSTGFYIDGDSVFKNCKSLKSIYLRGLVNESNKYMTHTALEGCDSLERLSYSCYGSTSIRTDEDEIRLLTNGLTHAARFFNAIEYYNNSTSDNNLYQLGYRSNFGNATYAYLNRSKVPNSLKDISADNVGWTSKTFAGLDNVEQITMHSGAIPNSTSNGGNSEYDNTFGGCNSLKYLDLTVGKEQGSTDRLPIMRLNIPSRGKVNAWIDFPWTIGSSSQWDGGTIRENSIPTGFKNMSLSMVVGNKQMFSNGYVGVDRLIPGIPINFKTNITVPPTTYFDGYPYYNHSLFNRYSCPTKGMAFIANSVLEPGFLKNDKYYYFSNNIKINTYWSLSVNNCVFWIDQMNVVSSTANCFQYVNNSTIYCNGFTYNGTVGTNTKVITKTFNVPDMINADINVN